MYAAYRRRNSLRLRDFDYSSEGAYFVTISCNDKKEYFNSSSIKRIVEINLKNLNKRFNIEVDQFCIMPDHVQLTAAPPRSIPFFPNAMTARPALLFLGP